MPTDTALTAFTPDSPAPAPSPIGARYQDLGGPAGFLGAPLAAEHSVPGGSAQDFRGGSLYWSSRSGAHEVHGAILADYRAHGGPTGPLGLPTTDEVAVADGVGRYNRFSNNTSIYYSPGSGAHQMQGLILAHYLALGGPRSLLGYPTTGETGTPDGAGRYNHFSNNASIYWTPLTGAHEVHGAIRALWAARGWERSRQGYPTSDEHADPVGRRSEFQTGYLVWNAATGVATAVPS